MELNTFFSDITAYKADVRVILGGMQDSNHMVSQRVYQKVLWMSVKHGS